MCARLAAHTILRTGDRVAIQKGMRKNGGQMDELETESQLASDLLKPNGSGLSPFWNQKRSKSVVGKSR